MPLPLSKPAFPDGFVWGVATAAPQIEGGAFEGGKGPSIWDRFCRVPGKVRHGHTLDVACDHYHRFDEDFALMAQLGVKHYRLSLAWPRIYPQGDGPVNPAGVEFYHRLFASMQRHGITPWATLFHWDLPAALEDRGGWRSRITVDAFARYAETVVREYAGVVKHWITLNEIRCFTSLAYAPGAIKAPGLSEPPAVVNQTFHHALVCHGHAVRAVRQYGGPGAQVGLTDNSDVPVPVTETPADVAAAKQWFLERNLHILDPISRGSYATEYLERTGRDAPRVEPGDFALISAPTDFLGMNIYAGVYIRAGKDGRPETVPVPPHYPCADSPWLNWTPPAMYWGPRLAQECYGFGPIYITENGCGYDLEQVQDGEVHDLHRREFLRGYLREVSRAVTDGVRIAGYFVWSFMDNFEWEDGYDRGFGIVHVDFATQKRTPKLSSRWYADVIRTNRIV